MGYSRRVVNFYFWCYAWVIMGDFNAIMGVEERIGQPVRERELVDMKRCVELCNMSDVKASGQFFTWSNKQVGESRVYCKLDRVVGNEVWMEEFYMAEVSFLPEGDFNHCLAIIKSYNNEQRRKPFRFFNMWSKSQNFLNTIRRGLGEQIRGTKMFCVVQKLKMLKNDLKKLNEEEFGDVSILNTK